MAPLKVNRASAAASYDSNATDDDDDDDDDESNSATRATASEAFCGALGNDDVARVRLMLLPNSMTRTRVGHGAPYRNSNDAPLSAEQRFVVSVEASHKSHSFDI